MKFVKISKNNKKLIKFVKISKYDKKYIHS